jgi:hypothetical protein
MSKLKTTFEIGEDVTCTYPLAPPLDQLCATLHGRIVELDGTAVLLEISGKTVYDPKIPLRVELKHLTHKTYVYDHEAEHARFDRAVKVSGSELTQEDMDGGFFEGGDCDVYWDADALLADPEDLLEHLASIDRDPGDLAPYFYLAKKLHSPLDTAEEQISSSQSCFRFEYPEDWWSATDYAHYAELDLAINTFNQANQDKFVYVPDYSRVYILERATWPTFVSET